MVSIYWDPSVLPFNHLHFCLFKSAFKKLQDVYIVIEKNAYFLCYTQLFFFPFKVNPFCIFLVCGHK